MNKIPGWRQVLQGFVATIMIAAGTLVFAATVRWVPLAIAFGMISLIASFHLLHELRKEKQ